MSEKAGKIGMCPPAVSGTSLRKYLDDGVRWTASLELSGHQNAPRVPPGVPRKQA